MNTTKRTGYEMIDQILDTVAPAPATRETASDDPHCGSCGRNLCEPKTTDCRWCDDDAQPPATPDAEEWSLHEGEDYIVVLGGEHDTTDNPIARCFDLQQAERIVSDHNNVSVLVEALHKIALASPIDSKCTLSHSVIARAVLAKVEGEGR
jgi:hypothetical protein